MVRVVSMIRVSAIGFLCLIAARANGHVDTTWRASVGVAILSNAYPSLPPYPAFYGAPEGTVFYDNRPSRKGGMQNLWLTFGIIRPAGSTFSLAVNSHSFSGDEEYSYTPHVRGNTVQSRLEWSYSTCRERIRDGTALNFAPGLALGFRRVHRSTYVDHFTGPLRGTVRSSDRARFIGLQPNVRLGICHRVFQAGLSLNCGLVSYIWGERRVVRDEWDFGPPFETHMEDSLVGYGQWMSPADLGSKGALFNDVGFYFTLNLR